MTPTRIALAALLFAAALPLSGCAGHGREVFVREECGSCHRFRDLGGGGAPDLTDGSSRLDSASRRAQITDPAAANPGSRMPAFRRLSWFALRSVVAFLRG